MDRIKAWESWAGNVHIHVDQFAVPLTTDIFCRMLVGKGEEDFIRDVKLYGIDTLIEKAKKQYEARQKQSGA